jgi:hypothetical protein
MPNPTPSLESKRATLEIVAYLQRTHGLRVTPEDLRVIDQKIDEAITSADDARLGLLRHLAEVLTPAAMDARGSGAAIVRAVAALREAGIADES